MVSPAGTPHVPTSLSIREVWMSHHDLNGQWKLKRLRDRVSNGKPKWLMNASDGARLGFAATGRLSLCSGAILIAIQRALLPWALSLFNIFRSPLSGSAGTGGDVPRQPGAEQANRVVCRCHVQRDRCARLCGCWRHDPEWWISVEFCACLRPQDHRGHGGGSDDPAMRQTTPRCWRDRVPARCTRCFQLHYQPLPSSPAAILASFSHTSGGGCASHQHLEPKRVRHACLSIPSACLSAGDSAKRRSIAGVARALTGFWRRRLSASDRPRSCQERGSPIYNQDLMTAAPPPGVGKLFRVEGTAELSTYSCS